MQCPKIKDLLNLTEIDRLKEILREECSKPENSNASVFHYIESIEEITYHVYFRDILLFLKRHKRKIDNQIKSKLTRGLNLRRFDLSKFKTETKQKYYKFKKNDWELFINKSAYFFSLYTGPFYLSGMRNSDYFNRAYLGFGFEFLLKAIFLKKGYLINKVVNKRQFASRGATKPSEPIRLGGVTKEFIKAEVHELGHFINMLEKIKPSNIEDRDFDYYVLAGLSIAQNWRNQDVHTPTGARSTDSMIQQHLKNSHDLLYRTFLPEREVPNFSKRRS